MDSRLQSSGMTLGAEFRILALGYTCSFYVLYYRIGYLRTGNSPGISGRLLRVFTLDDLMELSVGERVAVIKEYRLQGGSPTSAFAIKSMCANFGLVSREMVTIPSSSPLPKGKGHRMDSR
jgi:hypothetical protein